MRTVKPIFFQITKRKDSLLFLVLIIAGISLLGWLSGEIGIAAISSAYIPIAPVTAIIFIILSVISFVNINQEKSRLTKSLVTFFVIIIAFFCGLLFLNHTLNLHWDFENIFIKHPGKIENVPIGHISPITSLLLVFICIIILIRRKSNSNVFNYIGAGLLLLVCLASSVLLIGYLYKAPFLYGSKIIPVSLPAAICLFLFSITLLRLFEFKFWTLNLISDNKITYQLLKSFLPAAVFTTILQGFLITNFLVVNDNLPLSVALICLFVVTFIVFVVIRVSRDLGHKFVSAEKELRESESKYRTLVDNAGDGIGYVNLCEEFIFANSAAEEIFGAGKGELVGKNLKEFFTKEEYLNIINQTKIRESSQVSSYDTQLTLPDGKKRIIHVTAAPYLDDDENVIGTLGVFRDITELKKIETELSKQNSIFNTLLKNLQIGVYMIEVPSGKPLLANEASFNLLGRGILPEANSSTITKVYDLYKSDSNYPYPNEELPLVVAMSGVSKHVDDMVVVKPDGTKTALEVFGSPVLDDNGNIWASLVSFQDITERKQAELALKESESTLHQLNADKDRFIAILGHDLKNPFNNILGFSEILTNEIEGLNKGEIKDIAENIHKSARITNKLLEEILMWAKTQQGKIAFEQQSLNFKDIFLDTLEILNPAARAKNISVNCIAADQLTVFADNDMLKTVLRNLVSNAIKFTNTGGAINIKAEQDSENVTISVSDNGVGIPPDNLAKLFDISQVLTTTGTAKETGTGLGLLLCKEFVEKHGGKIWVESEAGNGSDFKFTLPYNSIHDEVNVVENIPSRHL